MNVQLLAHTQLSQDFFKSTFGDYDLYSLPFTDGKVLALTAIRTCYSPNKPSEIFKKEGHKYFGRKATDGKDGTDADRLIRHIVNSGHLSTLEHISFTFSIEGVSRSLLAQLTRHRVGFSYSVQSQRYVKFGRNDKSGGAEFITPPSIKNGDVEAQREFRNAMIHAQDWYDILRDLGVSAEDARFVLPNASSCNLVMTANLRSLLDFCNKRGEGSHAQWEIKELAERLKGEVVKVESWTEQFFA